MWTITTSFQLCFFSASYGLRSEFPPQSLRLPKCSFNLHDFSDHYFFEQFNFFFFQQFSISVLFPPSSSPYYSVYVCVKWKIIGKNFPFWHYVFPFNLVSMKKETYSFNRLFCNIELKFSIFINRLWVDCAVEKEGGVDDGGWLMISFTRHSMKHQRCVVNIYWDWVFERDKRLGNGMRLSLSWWNIWLRFLFLLDERILLKEAI